MLLMSLDNVEKEKDELRDSNSQHQDHRGILTSTPRKREDRGRSGKGRAGLEGVVGWRGRTARRESHTAVGRT